MLSKSITAAVGVIILPVLFSFVSDQDGAAPAVPASPPVATGKNTARTITTWRNTVARPPRTTVGSSFFIESSKRNSEQQKIKEAAKALRQAETGADRREAMDELTGLLGADYDSRLAEYEEYLDKLEEQLSDMRDKLAKRREAKGKMIDLRIQVLEAEADDLGWPSRMNSRSGLFPAKRFGVGTGLSSLPAVVAPVKPVQPSQPKQPNTGR